MSFVDRNRHWLLFAGVVLTTVAVVALATLGVVSVLAALVAGAGVAAVADAFLLYLLPAFLLAGLDVVLIAALVVTLAGMVSLPESDRLARAFERAERACPPVAGLGLADRFAPGPETRRKRLRRRYVAGELTELEFERRVGDLLDDATDASETSTDPPDGRTTARDPLRERE